MREIDFLPSWYPDIKRRQRWVVAQAWGTLLFLLLLAAYAVAQRWKVEVAGRNPAVTEMQIGASRQELGQLTEKLKYQEELRRHEDLISRVGIGVDTTRLLKALEDAMTPGMALTNLSLETLEQTLPEHGGSAVTTTPTDKLLTVQMDGVAPSDLDVAALIEHLQKVGCFDNIAPPYMREGSVRNGHAMREFAITFTINIGVPTGDSR
jgi:hypothetical protein